MRKFYLDLSMRRTEVPFTNECLHSAKQAYAAGWAVFVSHRSGETTDDFIADLTVGLRTGHLKSGAPARGERVSKYNRLMDIEDELKTRGVSYRYAATDFRFVYDRAEV